jgi:PAS domain S-box-containing protein
MQKLKDSELRYRRLFEAAQDGILILDAETGLIEDVNPYLIKMLGYSRAEFVKKKLWEVGAFKDIKASKEAFEILQESEYIRYEDLPLKTKDGKLIQVEFVSNVYLVGNEKVIQCNIRDITARRQAEAALQLLNAELEKRIEERTLELHNTQEKLVRKEKLAILGLMAGGLSHELRNPLGVINNAIYYLKSIQPDADAKVKEYLAMIEAETQNADKIISDLLDFARIESTDAIDAEPVTVSDLVAQTLERYPAAENIYVTLKIPRNLHTIYVNPHQVTQVFGNLVLNAYQAMKKGGKITLSAKKKGNMMAIAISDTGTGITLEDAANVFEPLFTTKPKGIGLGLTVSQKLAEANGGRIEVQSEPGKGSTFTVWLPTQ